MVSRCGWGPRSLAKKVANFGLCWNKRVFPSRKDCRLSSYTWNGWLLKAWRIMSSQRNLMWYTVKWKVSFVNNLYIDVTCNGLMEWHAGKYLQSRESPLFTHLWLSLLRCEIGFCDLIQFTEDLECHYRNCYTYQCCMRYNTFANTIWYYAYRT